MQSFLSIAIFASNTIILTEFILTPRIRDSYLCSYYVTEKPGLTHYHITVAWVARPERLKGGKDKVKRPKGLPAISQGPEGPYTFSGRYLGSEIGEGIFWRGICHTGIKNDWKNLGRISYIQEQHYNSISECSIIAKLL